MTDIRKVLVTGGCGFVGRNLTKFLRTHTNYHVTVIDNLSSSTSNDISSLADEIIYDDILNIGHTKYSDYKFDLIFHLAGYARIQPSFSEPLKAINTNTFGTAMICELARRCNAKIIYTTTSSSKHGDHISPYTLSKRMGEEILKMYWECYSVPSISVRLHNVYGPDESYIGEFTTVITKFALQYKNGQPLTVVGDGSQSRDFTHVEDICRGLTILSYSTFECTTVDLGREQPYTIMDIVKMFHPNAKNGIDYVTIPHRIHEGNHTTANMTKYRAITSTISCNINPTFTHNINDYINELIHFQ